MAEAATPPAPRSRPFAAFERMLAGRYLRARRRETFISVIAGFSFVGILLGVMTLIVVMAVMNGFRQELLGKILGINGHVIVQGVGQPFADFEAVKARIEAVAGVRVAIPFVEGQGLASSPQAAVGALVRGVRRSELDRLDLVSSRVVLGSLENFDESRGVAVGSRLARNLGLRIGDPLTLVTPRGSVTPIGVTPRIKAYPVVAIFEIGMSEYDSSLVFMPFPEAQAYFNLDDSVNGVEVFLADPDQVGATRDAIETAAGRPVLLTDWRQRHATYFSALQVERNVMFLILTLIVVVAALNIVAGLTMLVKDKAHDVAILRTMGATSGAVMRVFLMTGAAIGVVGTLAGFVLGVLFCFYIKPIQRFVSWVAGTELWDPTVRFLTEIPARMDPRETAAVVGMALVLSLLATVYPAWKAARLDPVEALRYE